MSPEQARKIALALPEAEEGAHMGHPDFRVGGKIFATLWPGARRAVVVLTPQDQDMLVAGDPTVFSPVPGGWGRRGATNVSLEKVDTPTLRTALTMAWRSRAPKRLVAAFDSGVTARS